MSKVTRVLMGGLLVGGCMTAMDGESTIEQFVHDPPANVTIVDVTPTRVTVSWDAVPGGTKYYVYQSENGAAGPFAYVNTARAPETSLRIGNLTPAANYCFVVRTDGPEGPGADSAPACVDTPALVTPAVPTNVTATFNADGTRAVISWTGVADTIKYYVFQSANGSAGPFAYVNTAVSPNTSLPVGNLTPGGSYCWAVQAHGTDGLSALSTPSCGEANLCGNGTVDPGEQCDDGNTTSGDGCSATCEEEDLCGNGTVDPGEQCDDGNTTSGDGCSATCEEEDLCGNGTVDPGEQCDDGNTTSGDGCSATCEEEEEPAAGTLFFSEYVEGSGNNKALEIKNPLTTDVDLDGCVIRTYFNGNTTSQNYPLEGTIAAGDVFVVCNTSASTELKNRCDAPTSAGALTFNGDDAVELVCNGTTLDVIGQIGVDPGNGWGANNTSTFDRTIRRKCGIISGDTNGFDAFNPATEWVGWQRDTFSGLGDPACAD